jgi:hypothetical protein
MGLFNEEHATVFFLLDNIAAIARFADQIGDIDGGERVGAMDLQLIARLQLRKRFARLQGGQGAIQSHQVKLGRRHDFENGPARAYRQPMSPR